MRSTEVEWLFGAYGGAARLCPAGWRSFALLGEDAGGRGRGRAESSAAGIDDWSVLQRYAAALTGDDASLRNTAAKKWMEWEGTITAMSATVGRSASALPWASPRGSASASASAGVARQPERREQWLWRWRPDVSQWECDGEILESADVEHALSADAFESRVAAAISGRQPPGPPPSPLPPTTGAPPLSTAPNEEQVPELWRRSEAPAGRTPAQDGSGVPAQAILTSHYSVHSVHYGGFTGGDEAVLSRIDRIRHIPCVAVHGGCDLICPPSTALALYRAWPEMQMQVVTGAGHSMYSPGLQTQVLEATDALRKKDAFSCA